MFDFMNKLVQIESERKENNPNVGPIAAELDSQAAEILKELALRQHETVEFLARIILERELYRLNCQRNVNNKG